MVLDDLRAMNSLSKHFLNTIINKKEWKQIFLPGSFRIFNFVM